MSMNRWVLLLLLSGGTALAAGDPVASDRAADADGVAVDGPQWDRQKGVWRYQVTSPYQPGPQPIEVLLPDDFDPQRRYRVLYALPVEPGIGGRYGDGLLELKRIAAHNRYGLICVAPAFASVPWYMDHASDPTLRHESYLLKVVVPLVQSKYPTLRTARGRLLLGFSKSGWGAFTLLLRHPDVFGCAASWDAPLMLKEEHWTNWGIARAAGTVENFRRYQPARLFASRAEPFRDRPRFALLGHKNFGPGGGSGYSAEHGHTRWAHATMQSLRIQHAYDNGIAVGHAWHTGWVKPAVAALMSCAAEH